jgi:hypothetical protein
MDARHWTDDDLLNRLYGVGGGDEAHLSACADCTARLRLFEARRSQSAAVPEPSHEFLAAQRRAIHRRLGESPARRLHWAPAFAAMLMLIIGFMLFRPGQTPQLQQPITDDSVFAEVYSLEQSSEPAAAQPIQALFEENQNQ